MIYAPIWKDTYYNLSDDTKTGLEPLEYSVEYQTKEGTETKTHTIFHGRAYQRPSDTFIRLNINKICKNYLNNDIQSFIESGAQSATTEDAYREFYLKDENGVLLQTYGFLYDWSYEDKNFSNDILMSKPINGHYDARMKTLMTYWESNDKSVRNYCKRGLEFDDEPLYPTLACGDYALYYQNLNGGWDSFLFEGNSKKKDSIKRNSISTVYNNQTLDFEKRNYNNQITSTYELHTGWLSDKESMILAKHLIPTTRVYLHDLKNNKIMPVTITDTDAEYKTFKTDKVVSYTINVEESRTKINI